MNLHVKVPPYIWEIQGSSLLPFISEIPIVLIFQYLMEIHILYRFSWFIFIPFSVFSSDWVFQSFKVCCIQSILLLISSIAFLFSFFFYWIFQLKNFFKFYIFFYLSNTFMFLHFLVICSVFSKWAFWILYQLDFKMPWLWVRLLEDYYYLLVMIFFINSSYYLLFTDALASTVADTSSYLYKLPSGGINCLSCYIWCFIWPCIDTPAPHFSLFLMVEILSLHVSFCFLQLTSQLMENYFCFPENHSIV